VTLGCEDTRYRANPGDGGETAVEVADDADVATLVGSWERPIPSEYQWFERFTFDQDGTFVISVVSRPGGTIETSTGQWTVSGGELGITSSGTQTRLAIVELSADTLVLEGPSGAFRYERVDL
jgi:hypothetical protein